MSIEMIGAFESTFQPGHDVDVLESTGHVEQRESDLMLLRICGLHRVRYPIRWHRLETSPGRFDWGETDEVFAHMHDHGWEPIVDLVHHTSYPRWLTGGFADPAFPQAYLRYVSAVVERYPWIAEYTLFNEPFSTLFLCGHEGVWPPYRRGIENFVSMLRNVLPAIAAAERICRDALPAARHLYVDSCEHHTGEGTLGAPYARYANDRRFFVLDALTGRFAGSSVEQWARDRPFVADVVAHGGAEMLELEPCRVDVVGLDYYAHCQWHFTDDGGTSPSPRPVPLADLIVEYADRYGRPVWLGETNLRGFASDRASWLKYTLEQCERAVEAGVDLQGYCWFPFVDSCDWDSLLYHCTGSIDPVGVFTVDGDGRRRPSSMTLSYARAGQGRPSSELPAFRFAAPVSGWLQGYIAHMSHWDWVDPPAGEIGGYEPGTATFEALTIRGVGPSDSPDPTVTAR